MFNNFYKKKLDDLLYHSKKNLPAGLSNEKLITRAFKFAYEAHKNAKRASGEPFFSHPYEVAIILAQEIPLDAVSIASALLHDVVEDTPFTLDDISAEFGPEIADIVDGATKIEGMFENYEMKQVESYKKMLLSMTSDIRVILIKFADRLHNLRTLEFLSNERQMRLAQETLEIFAPLANRFGLSSVKTELEDMSFKYLNRSAYDEIAKKLQAKKREREKIIKKFIEPLKERLNEDGYKFEIYGRAKHLYSIYKKIISRNKSFEELFDLFAIRIVLDTENKNDCFSVYGICSEIYIPVPERFKDYISLPKQNGYQSIHTTLISKEGKMFEVQIRTREMNEVAEKGIAAHWKYKENNNIHDKKLEEWMKAVRESIENSSKDETSSQVMESFKLNLYQDEIYCFTPKGDLKILPAGATAIDFAFDIHTQVGMKCIGAKVNGKIVTLDTLLKSGDQIEILTSKNQSPKIDWEKFAVTHKAKSDIRKFFNTEKRNLIQKGKELWEKKVKKLKLKLSDEDLSKVVHKFKYKDTGNFFHSISIDESKVNAVLDFLSDKNRITTLDQKSPSQDAGSENDADNFDKYVDEARNSTNGIFIGNGSSQNIKGIKYEYAKCCNPIPGDEVIGFISQEKGIRIHRKTCKNILNLYLKEPERIININWNEADSGEFTGGVKIIGEDRPGILNEITKTISKNFHTNIKSVDIKTKSSMFEGTLILSIQNLKQLNQIIDKITNQEGVFSVTRFEL
ncbi:MAG TPA: bifunctional (p)ppGpp synthetase/guanosine-3',5'-bis(diphosphate) 3'-pyrophosphohydrolase [Ignavibacteria bacterium]|nr:RelA/SpoT family protein [Bacteroidota bacterium]HRI86316.1 bifunctional (p)ppGpp synthetase/guanosine-3',5'-bis(diphosphate) 3'-pyrophosphohydrolase [Ignavibacteria bacterium]HRK00652.1 bifunctional (p)ppGpp synthetase/guanosine-3',5'-bis(diphosphate) 3'-pyrophosphohydrolase [Ignavibacteria bacterium]